jgi:hypothetical protein
MRSALLAIAFVLSAFSTQAGDQMYSTSQIDALEQLAQRDNFEPAGLYTGVDDPALRERLNATIHECVRAVAQAAKGGAQPNQVNALIKKSIWRVPREGLDTDDAERYAAGYEAILDALGIESSDGVLNDWMYGFDVEP